MKGRLRINNVDELSCVLWGCCSSSPLPPSSPSSSRPLSVLSLSHSELSSDPSISEPCSSKSSLIPPASSSSLSTSSSSVSAPSILASVSPTLCRPFHTSFSTAQSTAICLPSTFVPLTPAIAFSAFFLPLMTTKPNPASKPGFLVGMNACLTFPWLWNSAANCSG